MKTIKRIIVVDLLYLGDLLFAHPFFDVLRDLFPEARIDLVANSNFSEIMRVNPNLDHVYSYNKNWTVVRSYKFTKKLKMNNYQLGINIHGNWRTALLLKLISADKNIGYGNKGRGIFLDQKVEYLEDRHMVDRYLSFIEQLKKGEVLRSYFSTSDQPEPNNIIEAKNYPLLNINSDLTKKATLILKEAGLEQHNDFIVLNTGGSWKTKRWPEEYFAEIADLLTERGFKILFVGGPSDTERVTHILNKIENKANVFNLSGKTSLLELAAVLKRASLVISGDTGPVHVAAAVGTNTVAIFGPSDEKKYAPRGRGKNILFKNVDLDCRPCGEHECPLGHHKCMRELSPEMIVERIENEGLIG